MSRFGRMRAPTRGAFLDALNRRPSGLVVPAAPKRRPVVAWCIPLEEVVYATWFSHFLAMNAGPADYQITTEGSFIDAARNKLIKEFLKTSAEYLYFVDSDTCPPFDAVDRLLAHGRAIVGGWYRTKKPPHHACVYDYAQFDAQLKMHFYQPRAQAPEDDAAPVCGLAGCGKRHARTVERVDGLGFGSMLIRRDVLEQVQPEPERWCSVEEGGTEDLYFEREARARGFETHVDWSVHCRHIGLVSF